ncbi:MAG: metallophosphoesterase [Acidobacteriota bacterium]
MQTGSSPCVLTELPPASVHPAPSFTRRQFLGSGLATAGLCLAGYSGIYARHEFEVTHRTIPIRNLPDSFQNFHIVQISDIHLEEYTEPYFLEEIVRKINDLSPDLVLITGDYVSNGPLPVTVSWRAAGVAAEILSTLQAPQRFGILGNHDVSVGLDQVIGPLQAHGTPVLVDRHIPVERGSDRLWICGCSDAATQAPNLNAAIPADPQAPVLFMCHEPDYVEKVVLHPRFPLIDLMLSGHSHGGQIRLPFVGPLILPPMGEKYVEGSYQFQQMQLYVNRGLGTVGLPFRFNCPPELTHLTLIRA